MFEKVSQMAEQVATTVSRRQFLGRSGRAAMVLAAALGGLLALPSAAEAAGNRCCCATRSCYHKDPHVPCADGYSPCKCVHGCD